ncbi:LysR family transcriptional regulator [Phragmitibacter flavus]|uniref:LysR family transcriptional regulator n=1 Tax=Phragmitibacter flavus TaxID=2576071 RepID=A0A5R8KJL6_9BACT|nr:LysR substrate-binding domain-containing protein [Phragmitibacter flavus]TLD72447.1 LysR family transcriptional regulator [Phragmitibacter flavus]
MLGGVELRHLRYFVAVAEEENVSRAALRLHLSQPALSRQIGDMEKEMGFALLERGAKSVRLTDAGRVFLKEACVVLKRLEEGVEKARAVATGGKGELHIGYAPSLTPQILPRTMRAYQAEREQRGIKVLLHDLSTEEMLTKLRDGSLHLAMMVRPPKSAMRGLCYEELLLSPMCMAVHPEHALAKKKSVTVAQVVKEPIIGYDRLEYPGYYEELGAIFASTKMKLNVVEEHDSATSLIAAVEAGGGVAVVPGTLSCISGSRLKLIPIEPAPEPLSIGATWTKEGLIPSANRFLQLAIELSVNVKPV